MNGCVARQIWTTPIVSLAEFLQTWDVRPTIHHGLWEWMTDRTFKNTHTHTQIFNMLIKQPAWHMVCGEMALPLMYNLTANTRVRLFFTRITDVTLTLASCNLAFRGHHENVPNNGNFLSVIELLTQSCWIKKPHQLFKPSNSEWIDCVISEGAWQNCVWDKGGRTLFNHNGVYSGLSWSTQSVFRYVTMQKDKNDNPLGIYITESFVFSRISKIRLQCLQQQHKKKPWSHPK